MSVYSEKTLAVSKSPVRVKKQYSLMVLQPRALRSLAQTHILHSFKIGHGVQRTSDYERESGKTREEAVSKHGHGPAMSGMLMTPVTWLPH